MSFSTIWIVILNWNGLEDTLACLSSLAKSEFGDVQVHTIVMDNGSAADPTQALQAAFPHTRLIRLEKNIGFAAGCNVGIQEAKAAGADYVLLLNNDTIVEPHFMEPLVQALQNDETIGIAGALIKELGPSAGIDFAGGKINFGTGSFKHVRKLPSQESPIFTDYVTGACMMAPMTTFDAIGLFDENLFAYFEDVDLCLRAKKAGFHLACVPQSVVWHKGSASTRRSLAQGTTSPLKHYLIARNRMLIIERYAPPRSRWFHFVIINPLRTAYYIAAFVARRRWTKLRWFWRGVRDGVHGDLEMRSDFASIT